MGSRVRVPPRSPTNQAHGCGAARSAFRADFLCRTPTLRFKSVSAYPRREGRMNQSDFKQQLNVDGFTELEMKRLVPRPGKGRHRLLFEGRGLVMSGAFVVQQQGSPVVYRPGEVFSVAHGELHDEWIEADGATVLVGRKLSEA